MKLLRVEEGGVLRRLSSVMHAFAYCEFQKRWKETPIRLKDSVGPLDTFGMSVGRNIVLRGALLTISSNSVQCRSTYTIEVSF